MGARGSSKREIATDVWRMMSEFAMGAFQRSHHVALLKELGLTPGHLKVLSTLEPDLARPMGAIADACHCDPSMATWLVDRLEERGLVQRGMLPKDRRVKTVMLTAFGIETKDRLLEHIYEPPAALLDLDATTLATLRSALAKLAPQGGSEPPPWGRPTNAADPAPRRGARAAGRTVSA